MELSSPNVRKSSHPGNWNIEEAPTFEEQCSKPHTWNHREFLVPEQCVFQEHASDADENPAEGNETDAQYPSLLFKPQSHCAYPTSIALPKRSGRYGYRTCHAQELQAISVHLSMWMVAPVPTRPPHGNFSRHGKSSTTSVPLYHNWSEGLSPSLRLRTL
ncbi:hypothetical protein ACJ73_02903 [Blastomyces percursus]|uniref:Uncharacterized protein n=1 Tax=Blastomyces percursus TaxID=1658174 RepID=A0A1J9QB10_9EURO|nr:hypothetical protein ACJ73_02903 [Blastomyces percursus]